MLLIDSHAHLTDKAFAEDLDAVLDRAAFAGVERIVTIAESLDDSRAVQALVQADEMLAATAGVHPHRADSWSDTTAEAIAALAGAGSIVAVGETGLDYHYNFSTRENQQRAFRGQITLAKSVGFPLVIHCREAFADLAAILADHLPLPAGGVLHCFSGTADDARRFLDMGLHLGIGGPVTFRKADRLRQIVAEVLPLDRLLLETDAPYLAPEPMRGHPNEPAYVVRVAETIARVLSGDVSPDEVAAATRRNAMRLFRLGPDIPPDSIAYPLRNALYINLTNRCTNDCIFCARTHECSLAGYDLRLPREPSAGEVIAALAEKLGIAAAGEGKPSAHFDEVVFCGYGEPTLRLPTLLRVGRWLKSRGVRRIRLNTNGHGNVIHGRSIVRELASVLDAVSVSLNAANAADYARLCRPAEARFCFEAVCQFIAEAKTAIAEVAASAVAFPGVDMDACRRFAGETLGVRFRPRACVAR
ncbi:MAG: YchF/TatD family DNA exonuclease [Candidatus Sumerlaeia bacterium]|nr:YchF/TatD family DNA exonuclease [Candidatus Sumerlaeia bacterium]